MDETGKREKRGAHVSSLKDKYQPYNYLLDTALGHCARTLRAQRSGLRACRIECMLTRARKNLPGETPHKAHTEGRRPAATGAPSLPTSSVTELRQPEGMSQAGGGRRRGRQGGMQQGRAAAVAPRGAAESTSARAAGVEPD